MKNTVRLLATICLLLLINLAGIAYVAYDDTQQFEQERVDYHKAINEMRFKVILGGIMDSHDKAKIQAESVAKCTETEIKLAYSTDWRLERDLMYPRNDAKLYEIVSRNIKDKYINAKGESNDMFAVMDGRIIADNSLSTANKSSRLWEEEIKSQYNVVLADYVGKSIRNQSGGLIFWEPNPPANTPHRLVALPTVEVLKEVFMQEGIQGLAGYEILVPAYIKDDGDILGNKDINNVGIRQPTYKIAIVQGVGVSGILARHSEELEYLSFLDKQIDRNIDAKKRQKAVEFVVTSLLLIAAFTGASVTSHYAATRRMCEEGEESDGGT